MLLLFNGLNQKGFAKRNLNVFSLPNGFNSYQRYTHTQEIKKISDEVIDELSHIKSEDAILILVDKNDNGYKYYPIRKCKFLNIEKKTWYCLYFC